ncbi:hypothetical protein BGAL_0207g00060 [Botrytis galanthina]|uniref:Uncharacterized protein n=1 Tax=Botrytis galanthina TaxID=278940 RepID=A0A4S8QZR7_9HELO|nr:hypothetical protein BGAL_0207g00060 [Botrytis galanthina]
MSLARAFTTRRAKKQLDVTAPSPTAQRPVTPKFAHGTIKRAQISAPTELLSTTNMLSYNAPDLYPKDASKRIASSSTASTHSGEESDTSRMTSSTSLTSADTLSIESRSPITPAGDHLSAFNFGKKSIEIASGDEAPGIPSRAPSHTKKNHEIMSRKNSVARMSSPKSSTTVRSTMHMFSPNVQEAVAPEPHPFGKELAQVSEIAEEYGIAKETLAVVDEEEQELISRGLFKFRAEDYMSEIQGLFMSAFGEVKPTIGPVWI